MDFALFKRAIPLLAAVLVTQPVSAQTGVAPKPRDAYPKVAQCTDHSVPTLPDFWTATTLLTPFDGSELKIAEVSAIPNVMRVTTKGLESGALDDVVVIGNASYRLIDSGNADGIKSCVPIWKPDWVAPNPDLFSDKGCTCQGISKIAGADAEAWRCPVAPATSSDTGHRRVTDSDTIFDWFWFTKGSDRNPRNPLRFLMSRPNNDHHIPVLGDAALANLADVQRLRPSDPLITELKDLAGACTTNQPVKIKTPNPMLKGVAFEGCGDFTPPVWPQTAYADGALFSVSGQYMSMLIYYDYIDDENPREVSKIRLENGPNKGKVNDTRLTKDTTWEITWQNDQWPPQTPPQCGGGLTPVGVWHPDWAARAGCSCKAAITDESSLNPFSNTTMYAMSCFFGASSYIQSWYSSKGQPVLFYETNAGDLDLIDYYTWMPDAKIAAGIFNEPLACMQGKPELYPNYCADCHGGKFHAD